MSNEKEGEGNEEKATSREKGRISSAGNQEETSKKEITSKRTKKRGTDRRRQYRGTYIAPSVYIGGGKEKKNSES